MSVRRSDCDCDCRALTKGGSAKKGGVFVDAEANRHGVEMAQPPFFRQWRGVHGRVEWGKEREGRRSGEEFSWGLCERKGDRLALGWR